MKKHCRFFNLIEIAIAIAVVSFGVAAVLGVVPVTLRAYRDATAYNGLENTANFIKAYIDRSYSKSTWSVFCGLFGTETSPALGDSARPTDVATPPLDYPFVIYFGSGDFTKAFKIDFCRGAWSGVETKVDFSCKVTVYKELLSILNDNGEIYNPTNYDDGVTVVVKLEWPADLPTDSRTYKFDYFPRGE